MFICIPVLILFLIILLMNSGPKFDEVKLPPRTEEEKDASRKAGVIARQKINQKFYSSSSAKKPDVVEQSYPSRLDQKFDQ